MSEVQSSLDFTTVEQRRDRGIQQAVDHAHRDDPGWPERALERVRLYALEHTEFLAEDVRHWAEAAGFPAPVEPRAWGAVLQRAARAGLIHNVGVAKAKDSNLSWKVLWRRGPQPAVSAAPCGTLQVPATDADPGDEA